MKSPSVGPEERRHHPHQLQLMFDEYFPFWRLVFLFALASLVSAWMDVWIVTAVAAPGGYWLPYTAISG